jgi:PST family polysaccharide transporter
MALVFAPLVVGAIFAGLPFGPPGVALAYSAMMMLWVVPLVAWAVHGTPISFRDVMTTFAQPFLSGLVAMGLVLVLRLCLGPSLTILPRILLEGTALLGSYGAMLWYVMGQKTFYLSVLRVLGGRSSVTALSTEA